MSYQAPPPGGGHMAPHRGTMILVFGILGWVVCIIFGILAWSMGSGDLKKMAAGQMDPAGEGMTKAGKILGMISVIVIGIILLLYLVLGVLLAAGAAAS